jgi:hypothetical protein
MRDRSVSVCAIDSLSVCQRDKQMVDLAGKAECASLYEGRPLVSMEMWGDVSLARSITVAWRQPIMTAARESGELGLLASLTAAVPPWKLFDSGNALFHSRGQCGKCGEVDHVREIVCM